MGYWIFKVSTGGQYPDVPGQRYVYDNTHSVRVKAGDEFLYLEKRGSRYGLTGAGRVARVTQRAAAAEERRSSKVNKVFSAHLADVLWFSECFDLSSQTRAGAEHRAMIGLPRDLNTIGWSISMPQVSLNLFVALLDAALDTAALSNAESGSTATSEWRIDDSWSLVRTRSRLHTFRSAVLARHKFTCLICGCRLRSVLEVAHIRSYATDHDHRANPGNGICLCRFCHAAFDLGDVVLHADGKLDIVRPTDDPIALAHFTSVAAAVRENWMGGIDRTFLDNRVPEAEVASEGAC